jgi:hypothetical protein
MATVNVSWTTQDEVIPNAASFVNYDVQILQGTTVVADANEPLGSSMHAFLGIAPGDYMASVVLVDPSGAQAAPPVTAAFTVPAEATAPVPVTIAVNLS